MKLHWATALLLLAASGSALAAAPCAEIPHADHPKATLSNGEVTAVVFLPDATNGFYRGPRFDWSGVIPCAAYNGHTFFGEWFAKYDPLSHDSITGPVEDFRSGDTQPLYDAAPAGGLFVKIGVGILRKLTTAPYRFAAVYPIVDTGTWTVKTSTRSVTFRQVLQGPGGIAFRYEKSLTLDRHGAILTIHHSLKNTGTTAIDTSVYNHGFFMLDHRSTGAGMALHFPFQPQLDKPLGDAVTLTGNDLLYTRDLRPKEVVQGYIHGFSNQPSGATFTLEDRTTHAGVEEISTQPFEKFDLWSIPTTLCPEPFVHLHVEPGQTTRWDLRLRFFGPPAAIP